MKEVKSPKKPLIYYYCIVLLIIFLFNLLVTPLLTRGQVTEVDYGTFMEMTQQKQIGAVQVEDSQILFTDKEGLTVYKTAPMEDPNLTQRLYDSGAEFTRVIEEPISPIWSFLLTFILPLVIFALLGNYMSKKMMQQMGGKDSMAFGMGKSNAKVYVQSTKASNSPMWPVRTRPKRVFPKLWTTSTIRENTRKPVLPCPKGFCW